MPTMGSSRRAVAPGLSVAPGFTLPVEAVTETFAILAKRRAGKSNAAVVMAEEMFDAGLPWVAVDPKGDWWGIRASGDGSTPGLAVVVFGGLHGDLPLDPGSGRLVAELIAERRLTCVLDVSEMSKTEQRRFLADWAATLYRRNREPLHVFAEEADEYVPQRVTAGDARLVGAWETLIKRGGFRGLGVTLISQRSASLNKDALSQVETLIAMRTPGPQDRKAILGWVEQHDTGREVVDDLPALSDGEAWVFSPQWLSSLTKITFRRRRTFNSGATPTVGARRQQPPARLAEVDLEAIRSAMAETIEKAVADDPGELRSEVRRLRAEVQRLQSRPATPARIEVPVLSPEALAGLTATVDRLEAVCAGQAKQLSATQAALEATTETVRQVRAQLEFASGQAAAPPTAVAPAQGPAVRQPPLDAPPPRPSLEEIEVPDGGQPVLRSGARRMVEALGRMAPLRLTKGQWGTVAHLKTSGGTWSTYLSNIRQAGLIDETAEGFTLTEAGFTYLGGRPDPMSAAELQDHYRRILRAGAAKMLDALIDAYPAGLTRDELGAAAALATSGGTFSTYLSDLNRNGLAERVGDRYRATDVLIAGADAGHR